MVKRTVYYLSKLIEEQIFEGDDYTKLIKSVTINIVNFVVVQNDRVHNSFMFKEIDTNEILTDVAQIHFLELPKLNKNGKIGNELLKDWLLFIENPEGKEVSMIAEKIPEINMAAEQLKVLSHDSQARIEYEQRQKSLHEKVSSLNFARKEGEKKSLLRQMKRKFNIGQSEENIIVLCVDNDLIEQALDMIIDNAEKDEILNLFRH